LTASAGTSAAGRLADDEHTPNVPAPITEV